MYRSKNNIGIRKKIKETNKVKEKLAISDVIIQDYRKTTARSKKRIAEKGSEKRSIGTCEKKNQIK